MPNNFKDVTFKLCLEGAGDDDLFHLLSHNDLHFQHGKDNEKTSDPLKILRRHAVHLFHGGLGDVTAPVDAPLKDYSVLLYSRDSKGKKMIIKTTRLNGKVNNNLKVAVNDCAKEEIKKIVVKTPTNPKQDARAEKFGIPHVNCAMDRTLWIEAKVVPKKAEVVHPGETTAPNEELDVKTDDDEFIVAFVDGIASANKSDAEWDVVVEKGD